MEVFVFIVVLAFAIYGAYKITKNSDPDPEEGSPGSGGGEGEEDEELL